MHSSFKNYLLGCKLDLLISYLRIQQQIFMASFPNDQFLSCLLTFSSSTLLSKKVCRGTRRKRRRRRKMEGSSYLLLISYYVMRLRVVTQ